MEELAREVVAHLRDDDGPFEMSLLQEPNATDNFILITPVRTDGQISFNVRISDHRSGLRPGYEVQALNFATAAQVAEFASSFPRSDFVHCNRPAAARLFFVPTANPDEQGSVVRLLLRVDDDANKAYTQLISTLPNMRVAR